MEYYVLYDLNDNIICYYDNLLEFSFKLGYSIKEINRKYRNSLDNSIFLVIDSTCYRLFRFQ